MKSKRRIGLLLLVVLLLTGVTSAQQQEIKTGNKPSTFNYRINPYVRYNFFENDGEVHDYSVFMMTPVKWFGKFPGAFVIPLHYFC